MQRHAGRSLGPIQQHRIAMNDQFAVVEHSSPGFKDDAWWKLVDPLKWCFFFSGDLSMHFFFLSSFRV